MNKNMNYDQDILYNCPKCDSDNIGQGERFYEEDWMEMEIECGDCGFTWKEVWKFSYNILDLDTEEEE